MRSVNTGITKSMWSWFKRFFSPPWHPSATQERSYRGLLEVDDPLFGPIRWTRYCWNGTFNNTVWREVPFVVDRGTFEPTMPSEAQRACYQDFFNRFDEQLLGRMEAILFKYVNLARDSGELFGREKAAIDRIRQPSDMWSTLSDPSILIFASAADEPENTLAIRWSAVWDDEHGIQVLYREGGELRVSIIGDDFFDEIPSLE
jgi:hypothetical protein